MTDNLDRQEQPLRPESQETRRTLLSFLQEEIIILDIVAAYPHYANYAAIISEDTEFTNNPAYLQEMTTAASRKGLGLGGYNPLHAQDSITIELNKTIDLASSNKKYLPQVGVNTTIGLSVGEHYDDQTAEAMEAYIKAHPEFKDRLTTTFSIDEQGNSVKYFYVPRDFPIDEKERRAVIPNGPEKIVYDDITPKDIGVISSALQLLKKRLP